MGGVFEGFGVQGCRGTGLWCRSMVQVGGVRVQVAGLPTAARSHDDGDRRERRAKACGGRREGRGRWPTHVPGLASESHPRRCPAAASIHQPVSALAAGRVDHSIGTTCAPEVRIRLVGQGARIALPADAAFAGRVRGAAWPPERSDPARAAHGKGVPAWAAVPGARAPCALKGSPSVVACLGAGPALAGPRLGSTAGPSEAVGTGSSRASVRRGVSPLAARLAACALRAGGVGLPPGADLRIITPLRGRLAIGAGT